MSNREQAETNIVSFFNEESQDMCKRHENDGIPPSMQYQIKELNSSGIETVLDVGSGPGSLLLELLQRGMVKVIGLDLSDEMNEIARNRLKQEGFEEQVQLLQGSFLSTEVEDQPDAISMHRVLCCHPDREAMLDQSISYKPKIISLTVPRDWKILRLLLGIMGVFAKLTGSFRPYIHTQKSIDDRLKEQGYYIKSRQKDFWWVTTTYKRATTGDET